MGRDNAHGLPAHWIDRVHFEYSGTASGGTEVVMYSDGTTTARVLASTERLCVKELMVTIDTAGSARFFFDADDGNDADAGEILAQGYFGANGGFTLSFPVTGSAGAKPHVIITGGGNVRVSGVGYILKDS